MSARTLYVSTRNPHKLSELRALLAALGPFELVSAQDAGVPDVEEVGETFLDNAILKAAAAFERTGGLCLADDSGLSVDALDGAPGVYSARFSGPDANTERNNLHLLERLEGVDAGARGAAFICQLALLVPETLVDEAMAEGRVSHPWVPQGALLFSLQGRVEGRILNAGRGDHGFGYDPLFFYEPAGQTFAEMGADAKNGVSHRGRALTQLSSCLKALISAER